MLDPANYKMQISETQIKRYQETYKEVYGFDIDMAQATQELRSLVCLMDAVCRHQNKTYETHRNNNPP